MSEPRSAKEVFLDALDLPESERSGFVERECADDAELLVRVRALLEARLRAEEALVRESPGLAAGAVEAFDVGPGDVVGSYRLVRVLGEGGFGRVFLAEQLEPVKREVALKVIKLGMDTRAVMARFDVERQMLAMMNHPHIARVLDAGATESGRPFFVVEHVDGVPITEYCTTRGLELGARVELMRLVCLAIQHAHSKGVLHRDIKPTNVLVAEIDGNPQPRVIDFGIAKAMGELDVDTSTLTAEGHLVGMPTYMSPEQAAADLDIDTRSDVHALGAMLFELLTGRPPFVPKGRGVDAVIELARRVRQEDAASPSSVERNPEGISGGIPRELDWIILKCLEKDRDRRYGTASALALDLQRFLLVEPIDAAPPSQTYRLRKLFRRHRALATAMAVGAAALLVAAIGLGVGLVKAERALAEAERQARIASAVNDFLTDDLLSAVRPSTQTGEGRDVKMIEVLDVAAERIDEAEASGGRFADAPLVVASVRQTIGQTYVALGRNVEALPHLERAIELGLQALSDDDERHVTARVQRAGVLVQIAEHARAERELRELLPLLVRTRGPRDATTIDAANSLGSTLWRQGRRDEAATVFQESIDAAGEDNPAVLRLWSGLAIVKTELGAFDEAEEIFRRVAERHVTEHGYDDTRTLAARRHLATFLQTAGRPEDARPILEEIIEVERRVKGPTHPDTLAAMHTLGTALILLGEIDGADALLSETLEALLDEYGPHHEDSISAMNELARVRISQGDLDGAEELFREAHESSVALRGPDHPATVERLSNVGAVLFQQGRADDALTILEETSRLTEEHYGPRHLKTVTSRRMLAKIVSTAGDPEAADALLERTLADEPEVPPAHPVMVGVRTDLFLRYRATDRWEDAVRVMHELYDAFEATLGPDHDRTRASATFLSQAYSAWGRDDDAAQWKATAEAPRSDIQ